jgi:tRNA(Ile2) C34 agmatinyltransferase TiaS
MSNAKRLSEIRTEVLELLEEAKTIIKQDGTSHDWERAKAYWWGHTATAMGSEEYFTQYETTILNTIRDIAKDEPICPSCGSMEYSEVMDDEGEECYECGECGETYEKEEE